MATKTCPVCESPLTTDAVRAGRCQCCGSDLPAENPAEDMDGDKENEKEGSA